MPATTDSGSGNSCNREQEQSLSLPFSLREVDVDGKPPPYGTKSLEGVGVNSV